MWTAFEFGLAGSTSPGGGKQIKRSIGWQFGETNAPALCDWLPYGHNPVSARAKRMWIAEPKELDICEVGMQFTRCGTMRSGADVLSGILNCVCPECGGRMGERGREFRCQGECHQDWRQAWEQAAAILVPRSKRRIRRG